MTRVSSFALALAMGLAPGVLVAGCGTGPAATGATVTGATVTDAPAGSVGPTSGATSADPVAVATGAAMAIRAAGCRQAEELTGSGAVVADGLVVTVAHVVAGSDSLTVVDAAGRPHPATLVGLDPASDLALLAVPGLDAVPLELGALAPGDEGVFVVHDDAAVPTSEPFTVVRRADLSMADIYGDGTYIRPGFELDASVEPGDSGAVLVGDDGRAGAVVFATNRQDADRAWATDLAALDPLLAAPHDTPVPSGPCVS